MAILSCQSQFLKNTFFLNLKKSVNVPLFSLQNKFIIQYLISESYIIVSQLHLRAFSGKLEGNKRLSSKSTTHLVKRKLRHRKR